ncbi:MAG: hypothetical protein LBQ24_06305 [Candidatus Peribacteria bacterium]|nr:hypothetical protein [Candidatus Peribacteria bacterium]
MKIPSPTSVSSLLSVILPFLFAELLMLIGKSDFQDHISYLISSFHISLVLVADFPLFHSSSNHIESLYAQFEIPFLSAHTL